MTRLVFALALLAAPALAAEAPSYAPLPEKATSIGACVAGGWLYAYGGHTGKLHTYSENTSSNHFRRIKLTGGKWEELPAGPRAQGLALVAHGDSVIRVGGMQPRNKEGEKSDLRSLSSVAKYDPAAKKWVPLPDLPSGRSSHEAMLVGDKLYVVGGWDMRGKEGVKWHDKALVMDLSAKSPSWREFEQPFVRRALGAAAFAGKLYLVGGLTREKATSEVNVYDLKEGKWSEGPALPGTAGHGFSPAVCVCDGRLYAATADGKLHRLKADGKGWEPAGKAPKRQVARLVLGGKGRMLMVGGGSKSDDARVVEVVQPRVE